MVRSYLEQRGQVNYVYIPVTCYSVLNICPAKQSPQLEERDPNSLLFKKNCQLRLLHLLFGTSVQEWEKDNNSENTATEGLMEVTNYKCT